MIKDKTLLRNFIWNTVGSGLASFNSLFFMMAITRINGLEEAGIFSITFATASIFYIFALYSGRSCHTTDIKGKIKDKDYMVSRVITCVIMIMLICGYMFLNQYGTYKNSILMILCVWRGLEAFGDVFYGVMQKNGELHKVGKSLVIKGILGLALFIFIDELTKNLIYSCLSLCLISIGVIFSYDMPQALKQVNKQEKVNLENIKEIYKTEFFIFANTFLTMYLLNAPKYAIEKYLTDDIQAIFGIILMPSSILPLFAQFVVAPVLNKMTSLYKENEIKKLVKLQNKMILFILLFGVIAIAIGYVIGIPVLELLYKTDLIGYKIPFIIILFAYVVYAMGYVETILLTIFRKIKEQFVIYSIVSVAIFALSYSLVKQYGIYGASISYVIAMAIYYLLFYGITKINCKNKENIT